MKLTLKNFYLIGSIAFLLIVVCTETAVQATTRKFIASIAVSDNLLFIGEYGGKIGIFDMKERVVVARPSISEKHGTVQNFTLVNDDGRILAISPEGLGLYTVIFEITPEGDVKKIGAMPGRFNGLDRHYFYCSRYISEKDADHYKAFETRDTSRYEALRLNKELQNPEKGHIPGHPDLLVYNQAEDVQNYYFFCSLKPTAEQIKRGFALVSKDKVTGQMEVNRFPQEVAWTAERQDKEWKSAEITCDQESVWLLLISEKKRLIHFSKQTKQLTVTPYLSVKGLIKNQDETELPPWTYVGHKSNQTFPMSHDSVQKGMAIDDQHDFSKLLYYNRWSLIYSENLWSVTIRSGDDDSLYYLTKIPITSGDPEVFKIRPTFGDKVASSTPKAKDVKNAFELLWMLILGE